MSRIACIAGARPNFMKVKPVLVALEGAGHDVLLVHTGQHYDPEMSDVFFADLGLRRPDVGLGVGSGSHASQTARIMTEYESLCARHDLDATVVVGDVNSTLACALVAAKDGQLVAHVEAGLRSRDWAMPEEVNRVVADRVADLLLAPSPDAVANLRAEGYRDDQIHLVGNVMIDTLRGNVDRARAGDTLARHAVEPGAYGLITLHRPSNVDEPAVLDRLLDALGRIARDVPLVFPAHPRTRQRLPDPLPTGIQLIEPLGYLDFIALQADARLVLTDSGGIQEETTALGVPCLTLRENTERPITIDEGTNRLVGTDPETIVAAAAEVVADPPPARCPELWDGRAGDRIADVITATIADPHRRRPTDLDAAPPR